MLASNDSRGSRLDSWKEIAEYIGRDVRTAIRWERDRGLPVHRVPGGRRSAVFAYRDEVDHWLRGHAEPTGAPARSALAPAHGAWSRRRKFLAAGGFALAVLANAGVLAPHLARVSTLPRPRIDRLEAEAHALVARAEDGAEVWRYDLPTSVQLLSHMEGTSPWYAIADLDGDGRPETIASVPLSSASDHADYDELHVFSATGKVLWRQRLTDQFTFRAGTFGPPWCAGHVAVYSVAGRPRIAWAQGHHTWWPSPLVILDAFGRRLGTFMHPGQIRTLRVMEVAGRPLLLIGGVANAYRAAFMAVLGGDSVAGHGPAPASSPFECLDCGDAGPIRYFVFPPSDICTASDFPYNYVRDFVVRGDEVEAFTRESLPGSPLAEMVFGFSRDFELLDARSADSWTAHEALEKAGRLDHSVANCPWYRSPPPVREWSSSRGWVDLKPAASGPRQLAQR